MTTQTDPGTGTGQGQAPASGGQDGATAPSNTELADRIDALREVIQGQHDTAGKRVSGRLDRASTVEEQVQAELNRRDAERQRQAAEADRDSKITTTVDEIREIKKQLSEPPPQQPLRRAARVLFGGDK